MLAAIISWRGKWEATESLSEWIGLSLSCLLMSLKAFSAVAWLSLCASTVIRLQKSWFQLNKKVTDTKHRLPASLRLIKLRFYYLRLTTYEKQKQSCFLCMNEITWCLKARKFILVHCCMILGRKKLSCIFFLTLWYTFRSISIWILTQFILLFFLPVHWNLLKL